MEVQGVPEPYLVEKSTRRKLFFGEWFKQNFSSNDM
jgi:hypothetical protein